MPVVVVDALGREVALDAPARRVVSLVPSETESVAELAGIGALAGRTDWCIEPEGGIEAVPAVGGTKDFDVGAVVRLAPDLVLANQEENGRSHVEALIAAGLTVHVSFPKTVGEAVLYLRSLATLLGVAPDAAPIEAVRAAYESALAASHDGAVRVFVPIWRDPWMTFDGRAFASDLLELCGAENVFADRPRRYPLAADLGQREPYPPERVGDRDTRYPRVSLEEVESRAPDAVLLPDEPYRFTEDDARAFRARTVLVDGKDLFWYGTRIAHAVPRVRQLIRALRTPSL